MSETSVVEPGCSREVETTPSLAELLREFDCTFADKLGHRLSAFRRAVRHVHEKHEVAGGLPVGILETGTAREVGNWAGDGQSTVIWAWLATRLPNLWVRSIDLDPKACAIARAGLAANELTARARVTIVEGCGIRELERFVWGSGFNGLADDVVLLYLDSFDLDQAKPFPAAFHALKELCAIWGSLAPGTMVGIDDCVAETVGKHALAAQFFRSIRLEPELESYVTLWIKGAVKPAGLS